MTLSIDNPESESPKRFQTVDNLNLNAHQRFIDDTKLLSDEDVQKIFRTPTIAARAEVLTTASTPSAIDQLWELQQSRASPFIEPPGFVLAADALTHTLIPALGSGTEIIQKLESLNEAKDSVVNLQKTALIKFTKNYILLNTILKLIKSKQEEFHKG